MSIEQDLSQMGWTSHFQTQLEQSSNDGFFPARVVGVRKNSFRVSNGKSEWLATLAGRLKHDADGMYPVTGDWVLMTDAVISRVLERKNALSRGASGTRHKHNAQPQKEQVIAANLDTVFIVCGLDRDFNPRRIERYLTLVYNCGLNPVIILTKADLHQNPEHFVREVEAVALGVATHLVSASDDTGLASLESYLPPGRTTTMVGSSGAGKSTLVNRLYGKAVQLTGSISTHVGKGRHTTTSRDLIMMPQGGMVIDNPGIREIAFWEVDKGAEAAFPEIEKLGLGCRFTNCSHTNEPGCRVLGAVDEGEISRGRLESYWKVKREMEYLSLRRHKSADRVEKERWKEVALKIKAMKKRR
ncbi:MAG: ribosome small subunit-dependent GTPase A [Desulfarculaceae bacterium]|nr:ribosome small subunit-dependent GTPase A [Desulfarculaceae bacterium]MCF8048485.1 ribosome small subunit-dependent GTPase A [Desulfarculaceae bacterium]MCF8098302.1 ribosome small subunit-dependent GTPase A [Desulfarculaceae bacterium]MCF8124132.1 ribosome small subunit-dependent GTPase A [Desulfarculaceae bacterium]